MPQRSAKMPRVTYVVPMTPAASAAQVAMMQNKQRLAENAFEMAADAQEQLSLKGQNQGVMFLLIACFIIMFIYLNRA